MEVNHAFIVAHELKAPVALLRQLALSLDPNDKADFSQTKDQIVQLTDRAIRQINDLTKIARLDDALFQYEPVAINSLCDEVVQELNPLFVFNQRDLVLSYTNRQKLSITNKEMLKSIIYNFCLNAMNYSGANTKSLINIKDYKGKIRLQVRDFGPALPIDIWRALRTGTLKKPTSIAMRPGSSGLGLYISSQFAHYLDIELGAIRHFDGTSFFIDLIPSKQLSFSL